MKKVLALVLAAAMMLALGTTAFAAGGRLTVEQARETALRYAGVNAAEATFTKAHRDWDNGREVYEIEFYANGTEYDMDVDVETGAVTDFSTEQHFVVGGQPNGQPGYYGGYYGDDWYDDDWDDRYDHDDDWDDPYDWDDDLFDWDD